MSLVGMSPAVLTETIWALAHEAVPTIPDRIIVISTTNGRETLIEALFQQGVWQKLLVQLEKEGFDLREKLKFSPVPHCIRVFTSASQDQELSDIQSLHDSEAAAEFLMETVRAFTENANIQLIASIAGGRKTTSALLHAVMTLLGREQDRITHVLVDSALERSGNFYFPNDPVDQAGCVQLVDVPFVPLRYLFKRELEQSPGSFLALMRRLRLRAHDFELELSLQLNTDTAEITISGITIPLAPKEFLIYLHFALRALEGAPPIVAFSSLDRQDLETTRRDFLRQGDFSHWSELADLEGYDPKEDGRRWFGSIRKKCRQKGLDEMILSRAIPGRGQLSIDIPPDQIEITPST